MLERKGDVAVTSPFYISRAEYDAAPLFWLPPEFSKLEDTKPVYVAGSRGTGKTSLLRALSWEDRLKNLSLQHALRSMKRDSFSGKVLGIYVRIPDYIADGFTGWPKVNSGLNAEEIQGHRFALYIELIALQLLVKALEELQRARVFSYTLREEEEVVSAVLAERPELRRFMDDSGGFKSLPRLRAAFLQMHRTIRDCAVRQVDLEPASCFPADQIGGWLKSIGPILLSLANRDGSDPWRWKLCLDEAECLGELQQKAVNTLVRLVTHPFSVVVAFVTRPWDITSTLVPGLTNSDADVSVWNLDKEYQEHKDEFERFASGVLTLRLNRESLSAPVPFEAKEVLGDYGINSLLKHLIGTSSRKELKELYERAEALAKEFPYFRSGRADREEEEGTDDVSVPPIYQQYIIERKGLVLDREWDRDRLRVLDSSEIRKAQVAALVCFCREFRFKIPYAGWRIILSLSDSCIRDVLRQMSCVFDAVGVDKEAFMSMRVDIPTQATGVREASASKIADIRDRVIHRADEVEAMVRGLGSLLRGIQGDRRTGLDVPDRCVIQVRPDPKDIFLNVRELIREAQDGGFVTVVGEDSRVLQFVLHRLFAPTYDISYRRSSYTVDIPAMDVYRMARAKSTGDRMAVVRELSRKYFGDSYQLTFEDMDATNDEP